MAPERPGRKRTRVETSAGGVVYRRAGAGRAAKGRRAGKAVEVALASRRTKRGDLAWGLPKGLVERGEGPEATAVREVREETGLEAEVRAPLGEVSYWYVWGGQRVRKSVVFFLMEAVGGDVSLHDHEMEEVRWFSMPEALDAASYRSERQVLQRAAEALETTE